MVVFKCEFINVEGQGQHERLKKKKSKYAHKTGPLPPPLCDSKSAYQISIYSKSHQSAALTSDQKKKKKEERYFCRAVSAATTVERLMTVFLSFFLFPISSALGSVGGASSTTIRSCKQGCQVRCFIYYSLCLVSCEPKLHR